MVSLTQGEFAALVEEGIQVIPVEFRDLMKNVAVVVADEPTDDQLRKAGVSRGQALFGLYEGVPQVARGAGYGGVLPDKITIFKGAIERSCRSPEEVREQVRETVWHELAHHFGSSEQRVRRAQSKRRARPA